MKNNNFGSGSLRSLATLSAFLLTALIIPGALAATIAVTGVDNTVSPSTEAPLTSFRWLIEEDQTYKVQLNPDGSVKMQNAGTTSAAPVIDPNWRVGDPERNTLAVSFHRSYMPVVAAGTQAEALPATCSDPSQPTDPNPCLDPNKDYFISVLPEAGYSLGGALLKSGSESVNVYVNKGPIPTAQITIFVHSDTAPINNTWDLGEGGLEGFSIILEDAGGKYGASAGIQSQDVFGSPLCTNYLEPGHPSYDPSNPTVVDSTNPGGTCLTGADGTITIKNLAPGKYGVIAVPPSSVEEPVGSGNFVSSKWVQTSTIEGKKIIDAWVKANEPAFFAEFGPPGPHATIGFVPAAEGSPYVAMASDGITPLLDGTNTIEGNIVNLHLSRAPDVAFFSGGALPQTTPWVGLNMGAAGLGQGLYAVRTNEDGSFAIPNVPPGGYQLVVWDDALDVLFAKNTVTVNDNGTCNALTSCILGDVPVFQWFARMEHYVYNDENENGIWDSGEAPLGEQGVLLRFRDGTVYQGFPTDFTGVAPFDEVFPFFSWLVAEVDFARFKATGARVVVDDGGAIPFGSPDSYEDNLAPQPQGAPVDPDSDSTDMVSRIELGPVLTQGFQTFLGQTSVVEWGKKAYEFNENGGISGVVMYAVTRAENDPAYAGAEPWEPGIPRVTVNLYDETGTTLLAVGETDSWDDNLPTNCQYGSADIQAPYKFRGVDTDCFDGLRNWNQVRPAVFDGGYAFGPEIDCGIDGGWVNTATCEANSNLVDGVRYVKPGKYQVEVVPPNGYKIIKSHDRNVDFGEEYSPSTQLLPPPCSGDDYVVDAELSLFPGEPADFAGQTMKDCDRKLVTLSGGSNAAADFFLFTDVPISGHLIGFILDDTANEYDPNSPTFGEKYAPPFLPVSIRDWTGREISRTVSDEYGVYNALVPSTFTNSLGQPSGISPNMLTTCMNAKTKPNGSIDPLHNPQYSQFCYTFQYMPGSTTYLDTPVVPVSAFAGPDQDPLDCDFITGTPRIHSVSVPGNGVGGGPYIPGSATDRSIVISSVGDQQVLNPAYSGVGGIEPKLIFRDYGFGGTQGTVKIGGVDVNIATWTNEQITGTIPTTVTTGQLDVTRGDNSETTVTGVTVQVGLRQGSSVVTVNASGSGDFTKIQDAINAPTTAANALILVAPGIYDEMVIMHKPVQLQGWGEGSTNIDAIKAPAEKLTAWRALADSLVDGGVIDLIPGQEFAPGGIEPETFFTEEGAGVFVLAKASGGNRFNYRYNRGARIDGFSITGADTGGGVMVNGYGRFLEISNLRIDNNTAFYAGGIRVGHPLATVDIDDPNLPEQKITVYSDAFNDRVNIHNNTVTRNGGLGGAGGGIALHTGSDLYNVKSNYICGNFTNAGGAGFAHYGRSDNGRISDNTIIFNENFNQGTTVNGGGILISGSPAIGCGFDADGNQDQACLANRRQTLSPGSGNVRIEGNLIKGNSAGVGEGAGIRLNRINGQDIRIPRRNPRVVVNYGIDIVNNIIVNNVAALSGGGISIQDAFDVNLIHNTIANNDNTSTGGEAFVSGIPDQSVAQPGAGVVTHAIGPEVRALIPNIPTIPQYSKPKTMKNNIIWQNRMFYWQTETSDLDAAPVNGLCPDLGNNGLPCNGLAVSPIFNDIAVVGTANPAIDTAALTCTNCILSGDSDPVFVSENFNGSRNTTTVILEGTTSMQAPPAFDEGGNFIRLRYGPLTQTDTDTGVLLGDYHLMWGSSALDTAPGAGINTDIDGDARPSGVGYDIGADEAQQ